MAPQPKARNWCFTINNPGTLDAASIDEMEKAAKYLVVGNEFGENGTHHFQGFIMFKNQVRLPFVKVLNSRAHWEIAQGGWEAASDYCKKDGDFMERGTRPATQKRKGEAGAEAERERWKRLRDLAKVGDYDTLEDEFPRELTLYEGCIDRLRMRFGGCQDQESGTVNGIWIYGPSGTGKTYYAMHKIAPRDKVYLKDLSKFCDRDWETKRIRSLSMQPS